MKNLAYLLFGLLLITFISCSDANGQTPQKSSSPKTEMKFKTSSSSKTAADITTETVTIAGKAFDGGYSKTGSIWILRVSQKSGNEYKAYLGTRTDMIHEGHAVWTNKSQTKYWFFTINEKTGYPKTNKLEVELEN